MSWAVNWSAGSPSSWRRNHQIPTHRETMRSEIIIFVLLWIYVSLQKDAKENLLETLFFKKPSPLCILSHHASSSLSKPATTGVLTLDHDHVRHWSWNLSYQPLTDVATIQSLLMVCQCIFHLFSAWLVPCPFPPRRCPSAVLEPMQRSHQSTCKEERNNSKLPEP